MLRRLMVAAVMAGALWSGSAAAQQSVKTQDCSPVAVGDDNVQIIKCGYSAEDYENALARREAQIRSDLERAHTAEKQVLQLQLNEVQRQRADLQASYEQTVQELAALRSRISDIGEGVEQAKIDAAKQALASGDRSKADALFAEVERLEQESIARAAEAAYQRGIIAEQEIRFADAADHFSKAARMVPNNAHLDAAQDLAWRAGRFKAGYRFALERLDHVVSKFGSHTQKHSEALNDLAVMLKEAGWYTHAERHYREAIEIDMITIGDRHPDHAIVLSNLSNLLRKMGRYEEAEPPIRKALDIGKRTIGTQHPNYARRLNNLAILLIDLKRPDEAESLLRQALEITATALGTTDPEYSVRLANLSDFLRVTGRPREAEPLIRQAIEITKATLGPEHPVHAQRLNYLANILSDLSRLDEAEQVYRDAIKIGRRILGPNHPDMATRLNNLAILLEKARRYEEAKPIYGEMIEVALQGLGKEHPRANRMAWNYADLLRKHFPDDPALAELEAAFGSDVGRP
ncbi:MAG: tetratricopeptide repeat protein [Pseudomonadota bacterium]